jgi:hypothetical protein
LKDLPRTERAIHLPSAVELLSHKLSKHEHIVVRTCFS